MKRLIALTVSLFFIVFFKPIDTYAQAYIENSQQYSNNTFGDYVFMKVVNGEVYTLQVTDQVYNDAKLKKYAVNGTLLYTQDILVDHSSAIAIRAMEIINDEVYLLAGKATNVGCCGMAVQAIKVRADGSIAFSRVISDTTSTIIYNPDSDVFPEIILSGNHWIISAMVKGMNFPTTLGGLVQNDHNLFLLNLNATTGEIIQSLAIPSYNVKFVVENEYLYIAVTAERHDLPVTIGNLPNPLGASYHSYVRKMNLSDFSTVYSRYVSVNTQSLVRDFLVQNGELHIAGTLNAQTAVYTKLYADGTLALSKELEFYPLNVLPDCIKISANHVYISGNTGTTNQQYDNVFALKLNFDGSRVYLKNNPITNYLWPQNKLPIQVVGDDLYMVGAGAAANYPTTNNSTYIGPSSGYVTHYGPSGNLVYSSFTNPVSKMEIVNNKIYLAGYATHPVMPSTDSSQVNGAQDCFLTVIKADGTTIYNGYFGGSLHEWVADFVVENGSVFLTGPTSSPDFPTTQPAILQNTVYGDPFLTKISFCPDRYNTSSDTLSPSTQVVCKYGLGKIIQGRDLIVPADSLPLLYANSVQILQRPAKDIHYQWQKALSLSGPWTNIQGATDRDFRPVIGTVNEYFRRQAFLSSDCNTAFIHTSDTAAVIAGANTAPTIDFGGPIITCPSSPVQLNGTAAITGGQPPYTYSWDMGLPSIANPIVAPYVNTVYTLQLMDMAGCQQLGQVVVSVYKANAGVNKNNCAGLPVRIGTAPLPATSNISYAWTPVAGLDADNIAQPMANPTISTDYMLTVNLTKPDGSICITHDTVNVKPVAAPVNPQFAGPDKLICNRDSITVGTPAETGFTYSWTPATYITRSDTSQTYYYPNPPLNEMPVPDPATLYLYAKRDGCTFSDTVVITTIETNAGETLCHAGTIGLPDRTPGISELYSWALVSGPGNFLGPTNTPQVVVTGSVGGPSQYELTVSYNGKTCQGSTLVLPSCPGGACLIQIEPSDSCVSFAANGGQVTLRGISSIQDGVYTWEPHIGLSAYTGNTVQLTDNVPRTYILTVVSAHDSSLSCSTSITTNPALQPPVFSAADTTTCAGVPVMIGAPPVPGNTYDWVGFGLSNYHISNPVATVSYSRLFYVTITNARGCKLKDTILVTVPNTAANAGGDKMVCSNAIVTLGSDSLPNTSYSWDPPASSWQNGTDQFSAHPQVLAATTVTYTLTTTTGGCPSSEEVTITVNNSPMIYDAPDDVSCAGSGTWIGGQSIPGVIYQWSPVTGLSDPTSANTYASPATTTTYTLSAIFPGDCALPATDEVTVTVRDPAFSMPDIYYCAQNGPLQLGTNVPTGMSYYEWQPHDLVTDYSIPNPLTIDPPPGNSTNLVLTVGDNYCYYSDTLQLIPVTEMPVAGADRTVCKDQPVYIGSVSNATGATISYQWSPINYLNDATSPNPVFEGPNVGTYQYVLTRTDNSIPCSSSDTVLLTVVDILPEMNGVSVCRNSCVQVGTAATSGITYTWMPQQGLSDPTLSNPVACVDSNTVTYALTANDGNGCIITDSITLSVMPIVGVNASVPNIVACVGDANISFSPTVPAGSYSWLWSPDNGTLSNINIPNPIIQTANAGTTQYSLQITDNTTGCANTITAAVQLNTCSVFGEAGNFMWFDLNENGIQDNNEPGLAGAVVNLYNNIGYNVATTVTDGNGAYNFTIVPPGNDYYIIFSKPAGYEFTIQNVGGVTASDNSKADATGRTNNFNLTTGATISNIDAGIRPGQIVPVTILSFTATLRSNKTVLLNWQTSAEINNDYFDVERSNDGINFNFIGRVEGNGTTSLPHSYSLIDPHPLDGLNYYRLKQVDFDGHATLSHIEVVELKNNDETVTAWYNNQGNSIQLLFNKAQNNLDVKLYASNGQLIKRAAAPNNVVSYTLNLPVLSTGVYMLQVVSDKTRYSKKIFINK